MTQKNSLIAYGFVITLCLGLTLYIQTWHDIELFMYLNSLFRSIPDPIWCNATLLGDAFIGLFVFFPFIRKKPELFIALACASVCAALLNLPLKTIIQKPRPPALLDGSVFHCIGPAYYSRSIPSGHTVTIVTITTLLLHGISVWYMRLLFCIIALLVSLSRVAVGAHWVSDICAGTAIGCFSAGIGVIISKKIYCDQFNRFIKYLYIILLLSGAGGIFVYASPYPFTYWSSRFWIITFMLWGSINYFSPTPKNSL